MVGTKKPKNREPDYVHAWDATIYTERKCRNLRPMRSNIREAEQIKLAGI